MEPRAAFVVTFLPSRQSIPMCVAADQRNSCQNEPANLATAMALLDPAALPEYFDYFGIDKGALATAEPVPAPDVGVGARAFGF